MGRIIDRDEFKASMRMAAADMEVGEIMGDIDDEDAKEAEPRKKRGPKPGTKKKPENATVATPERETGKTARTKKAAPVAAGQKKTSGRTPMITGIKSIDKAMSKSDMQREALMAAVQIMTNYTEGIILKADKLANMADIYAGHIEILEGMI